MAYKRNNKTQIVILVTENIHTLLMKDSEMLGIAKTKVINNILNEYYINDLKKINDK